MDDKSMQSAANDLRRRLVHQFTHTELMSSKLEKIIDLYRDLNKIPLVSSGFISRNVDDPHSITVRCLCLPYKFTKLNKYVGVFVNFFR